MSKKTEVQTKESEVAQVQEKPEVLSLRSVIDIKKKEGNNWQVSEVILDSKDTVVSVKPIGEYDMLSEAISIYKQAVGKHLLKVIEGMV
jgi:hypothetical protein